MIKRDGFTIVELLIVIVVIGILAAITILAYTGIQAKATVASLQSDLENSNKQLIAYLTTSSTGYPTAIDCSASPASNTICLKSSSTTTYQYTANNTSLSAPTYCLTATTGTTSYFYSSTSGGPTAGACVGHSNGGAPLITNYSNNPSLESGSAAGYSVATWGTNGAGTISIDPSIAYVGTKSFKMLWTTATTGAATAGAGTPPTNLTAGNVYTFSIYVRSTMATIASPTVRSFTGAGGTGSLLDTGGTPVAVPANTWVRVSNTITIPAGYLSANMRIGFNGAYAAGDSVNMDANMITDGTTLYNYTDPTLNPGWSWTSGTNTSPSTGYPV